MLRLLLGLDYVVGIAVLFPQSPLLILIPPFPLSPSISAIRSWTAGKHYWIMYSEDGAVYFGDPSPQWGMALLLPLFLLLLPSLFRYQLLCSMRARFVDDLRTHRNRLTRSISTRHLLPQLLSGSQGDSLSSLLIPHSRYDFVFPPPLNESADDIIK